MAPESQAPTAEATTDRLTTDECDRVNAAEIAEGDRIHVCIPRGVRENHDTDVKWLKNAEVTAVGRFGTDTDTISVECDGWKASIYTDYATWKLCIGENPTGEYIHDRNAAGLYFPADRGPVRATYGVADRSELPEIDGWEPRHSDASGATLSRHSGKKVRKAKHVRTERDLGADKTTLKVYTRDETQYVFEKLADEPEYRFCRRGDSDNPDTRRYTLPTTVKSVVSAAEAGYVRTETEPSPANASDETADETAADGGERVCARCGASDLTGDCPEAPGFDNSDHNPVTPDSPAAAVDKGRGIETDGGTQTAGGSAETPEDTDLETLREIFRHDGYSVRPVSENRTDSLGDYMVLVRKENKILNSLKSRELAVEGFAVSMITDQPGRFYVEHRSETFRRED